VTTHPAEVNVTISAAPVYELSLNARKHWRTKHRATQTAKDTASLALIGSERIAGPVELDWEIDLPRNRKRMDWDNAIATLKPYMDSLVIAGIIEDDKPDVVKRIGISQSNYSEHKMYGGEIRCRIRAVTAR